MLSPRLEQLFNFLEQAPDDTFTIYSIAFEYMIQNDLTKAYEYFQKLKAVDPQYTGLYYHLGKTLEKMNQLEEAINVYREGIPVALKNKDRNAHRELLNALNEALEESDDF
jgi:tetratricopeptide (TPR) repeat protein